jgi:hypothetical protein
MIAIPFRIRQIKTQQFAMFPDLLINGNNVAVKSEFNFGVNSEVKDIFCITRMTYSQDEKLLLTTEVICFFEISEEGSKQLIEQGRIEVDFLRYLATIATGTVRGIIHTKTENTSLNPIVLPPINLVDAIKEDFVFKNHE